MILHNDGLHSIPYTNRWLADFALLIETGITRIFCESGDNKLITEFTDLSNSLSEKQWLNFFLSPLSSVWYFDNKDKSNIGNIEFQSILTLQQRENLYKKMKICNGVYLWLDVPSEFKLQLNKIGRGSKGVDSKNANFLSPDSDMFQKSILNIKEGLKILQANTPGYFRDFIKFSHSIALVDDKASFRGGSNLAWRGLMMFSPDESWDKYKWAEELLHESTHGILHILTARIPLINNTDAFEEKYKAPFRDDLRHLHGNFHALTVMARCIKLFDIIKLSESNIENQMIENIKTFKLRAKEPMRSLTENAEFSEIGAIFYKYLIRPTFQQ